MKCGRIYEVFVDGKPIGLVGSTIMRLQDRRVCGYTKRFGPSVELRLIREIPIPDGYDEEGYNFRLKAAEAFDIVRKKTYISDGGQNKISPLIQVLGQNILETERGQVNGRVRGLIQGRKNVESGHIRALGKKYGPVTVRKISHECVLEGQKKRTKESWNEFHKLGGSASGKKQADNGRIQALGRKYGGQAAAKGRCGRWQIQRGKSCICGKHASDNTYN